MKERAENVGTKAQQRQAVENTTQMLKVRVYDTADRQINVEVLLEIGITGSMVTGMAGGQVALVGGGIAAGSAGSAAEGGAVAYRVGTAVSNANRVRVVTTEALEAAKLAEEAAALEEAEALLETARSMARYLTR